MPLFDYLLFEAEFQDENDDVEYEVKSEQSDHTGQGFVVLAPDATIQFTDVQVQITWQYYLVVRHAHNPQYQNTDLTLTLESNGITTTIKSSQNRFKFDERSILTLETFLLTANQVYNVTVSLTSTSDGPVKGLSVDSLVLKPDLTPTRINGELNTMGTLLRCFFNANYHSGGEVLSSQCSDLIFSFSAEMYNGALGKIHCCLR